MTDPYKIEAEKIAEGQEIKKNALISDCGKYRYWLGRSWRENIRIGFPPVVFVMLNPSTADASLDDPTIRRCIGFARREGAGSMMVMNLFAVRSPDPKILSDATDPIGPDNDHHLRRLLSDGYATVICAWGSHKLAKHRAADFMDMMSGRALYCLGTTVDGSPRHPLYVKSSQPIEPFNSTARILQEKTND